MSSFLDPDVMIADDFRRWKLGMALWGSWDGNAMGYLGNQMLARLLVDGS